MDTPLTDLQRVRNRVIIILNAMFNGYLILGRRID